VALAQPPDRRIAGHRADGGELMRDQRALGAHARGGSRRLASSMAAAYNDNIEPQIQGPKPPEAAPLFVSSRIVQSR